MLLRWQQRSNAFATAQYYVRNSRCYKRDTGLLRAQQHAVAHDDLAAPPQIRVGRLTVMRALPATQAEIVFCFHGAS